MEERGNRDTWFLAQHESLYAQLCGFLFIMSTLDHEIPR